MKIFVATVLLVTCCVLLFCRAAVAGNVLDKSVDTYVRDEMIKRHIPGAALAVIWHGRIQKRAFYGDANLEFSVPVTSNTVFNVASITKEFTSVAVMILVEAGKIKLDDHIGTYLNELPSSWQNITIWQLLSHTSGLPDAINQTTSDALADTSEEILRLLRDKPMDFPSGSKWSYNQTNYMLLGLLIEKLSGQSFTQFCTAQLFAPLKLSSPTFGGQTIIKQRTSLYTILGFSTNPPTTLDHLEVFSFKVPPMLYPAGALNISLMDFARWLNALMNGKLITKASMEELWAPARLNDGSTFANYGLGWWLVSQAPHLVVGGNGGGRVAFMVYPKDELAVIVLTNLQGSQPEAIVNGVASQYLRTSKDIRDSCSDGNC